MIEPSLNQLEHEVQAARGKLASDLSTLRSPATAAEFTDTLKQEAIEAKDALLVRLDCCTAPSCGCCSCVFSISESTFLDDTSSEALERSPVR
jgi:hypothetical protein